jgi:hypothetical protein
MKVLWYLNLADGKYPWIENGLYPVDFDRYRRLAETNRSRRVFRRARRDLTE